MWIFLNDAMLSIVAHREQKGMLLVRARVRGDIETVFPGADVWEDNEADYRWRAIVPREDLAQAMFEQAYRIDYTNFKGSIPRHEVERHDWYLRVWREGERVQQSERVADAWSPVVQRAETSQKGPARPRATGQAGRRARSRRE